MAGLHKPLQSFGVCCWLPLWGMPAVAPGRAQPTHTLTHTPSLSPFRLQTWHEPGAVCWEPVFVPRPGAQAEDSGLAISTLMQADGCTALLMLDGSTFKEVARAVMPFGVPNGFHGCFVAA